MDNMIKIEIDGELLSVDDLDRDTLLWANRELANEVDRRTLLQNAERESELLAQRYLNARDGASSADEPPAWVQPRGAFDAYPVGYMVTHNGKRWTNITPFNAHEPGVSGWREYSESTPDWIRPTGAHDAYFMGDRVMFGGLEYISLLDANVHSPAEYPPGWEVYSDPEEPVEEEDDSPPVEEDPDDPIEEPDPEEPPVEEPDPEEPEEPVTPEEPGEPVEPDEPEDEYPAWKPWDHVSPLYQIGDRVTHNGKVWEATDGNNHWEPGEYGWEEI